MKNSDKVMWAIALFGAFGTAHYFYGVLTPNSQAFAIQISSYLDQAYKDCKNLNEGERSHMQEVLLSAQKALTVENNYNKAVGLVNSVSNDLLSCSGKLELPYGGAEIMAIIVIFGATALGIKTILEKIWSKYDSKRKS